jgi:hypothetical protein
MTGRLLDLPPTGANVVAVPASLDVTRTRTLEELSTEARDIADEAGHMRSVEALRAEDWGDLHHRAFKVQLNIQTVKNAKRAPVELLGELADLGFEWREIARMLGVSVPALRRWRQGEPPTGEHRRDIAQLVAFTRILAEDHMVADIASWMEVPISTDAPVTAIDLYVGGHALSILELASEHAAPDAILDRVEPGWRERFRSDFEVFVASDGQTATRLRTKGGQ